MYVSSGKSSTAPTSSQRTGVFSNSGPRAKPMAGGLGLRAGGDDAGQRGDALEVTVGGEQLEAQGVQAVAGQQGEVRLGPGHEPRLAGVQPLALAHGGDVQRGV